VEESYSFGPMRFKLLGDGFLTITIDEELEEIEVTKDIAEGIIEMSVHFLKGRQYPFLFLYNDLRVKIDKEVTDLIANHPELLKVKKAEAIVSTSVFNLLVVNFYVYFFKPPTPVRVFRRESAARKWLSKFL